MSFTKQISTESTTYCNQIRINGHNSVELRYTNTIEGKKENTFKTPQECVEDGAITIEEQEIFSTMLGKLADFYNPDKTE